MKRRGRSRFVSVIVAFAATGLVATACGSSPPKAETGQAAPAAASQNAGASSAAPQSTPDAAPAAAPDQTAAAAPTAAGSSSAPVASGASSSAAPAARSAAGQSSSAAGGSAPSQSAQAASPKGGGSAPAPSPAPGVKPGPGAAPAPNVPAAPGGPKGEVVLASLEVRTCPMGAMFSAISEAGAAWTAWVNDHGGLNGHHVKLLQVDDGGEPSRSLALAKRMVEEQGAIAIFASSLVTTGEALAPYAESKGIPIIGTCGCTPVSDTSKMFFQAGTTADIGTAWAHVLPLLAQSTKRKIGILYCKEAPTCPGLAKNIEKFQSETDMKVVYSGQVSIAAPDYTAEVLAARNAGADALVTVLDNASTARVARAAHRQSWNPDISTQYSGHDERLITQGGKDVEGVMTSSVTAAWDTSPLQKDYRDAMDKYLPGAKKSAFGGSVWASGEMLRKMSANWPDKVTSKDIVEGFYSFKLETVGGLTPPITYKRDTGHFESDHCIIPVQVKDGKFVPYNNDPNTFICAPHWRPVGGDGSPKGPNWKALGS